MVQFFIILDMQWSEMAVNVEYFKLHHHFSIVLDDEFGIFIGPLGIFLGDCLDISELIILCCSQL